MARIIYPKNSFYKNTPIRNWYLDIWSPIQIPESGNDIEFIIPPKYNLRPDLASYDFYGSPDFWFVFALRNKNILKDPIFDFKSGTLIIIPPAELIKNIF